MWRYLQARTSIQKPIKYNSWRLQKNTTWEKVKQTSNLGQNSSLGSYWLESSEYFPRRTNAGKFQEKYTNEMWNWEELIWFVFFFLFFTCTVLNSAWKYPIRLSWTPSSTQMKSHCKEVRIFIWVPFSPQMKSHHRGGWNGQQII